MSKKLIAKTVARTLFYQYLGLFIGISLGFIFAPNYWGSKAPVLERSIQNIFYPIEYNDNVQMFLMDIGKSRLWVELDDPPNLTFYNSKIIAEEWFETDYSYTDKNSQIIEGHYRTRIKWKPWEYDYQITGGNRTE